MLKREMAEPSLFFAFLDQDEPAKLVRVFNGYLLLAQWESAKVTLRQIATKHRARAREMLLEIVLHGPPPQVMHSNAKRALPAPAFLAWLCYAEFLELGGRATDVPARRLEQLEFEMALVCCQEVTTKEQFKLLERLRELAGFGSGGGGKLAGGDAMHGGAAKVDLQKKLSATEHAKLLEIFANSVPNHVHRLLAPFAAQNTVCALISYLLEHSGPDNRAQETLRLIPLLALSNLTGTQQKQLDALLQLLLLKCSGLQHRLVEAMLACDDATQLLSKFAVAEDALIVTKLKSAAIFSSLGDVHCASLLTGKHPFELVLESCVVAIGAGPTAFAQLDKIATCFPLLRNLVLAMAIKRHEGNFAVQKALFDALEPFEISSSDPLYQFVTLQRHRLQMADFLSTVCEDSPSKILSALRSGTSCYDLVALQRLENVQARSKLLGLVQDSAERVALRVFFVACDLWNNALPPQEEDVLFGASGSRAEILAHRDAALALCAFAVRHAPRQCGGTWDVFGRVVRSVNAALQSLGRDDAETERTIDMVALRELTFRVELDLGLRSSPAQLLIDCATNENFAVCDRLVAFYGESLPAEAVAFWGRATAFARVRSSPLSADAQTLKLDELLDLAFLAEDPATSLRLLEMAQALEASDQFASTAAKICKCYGVSLQQAFGLCRKLNVATVDQQLAAETELQALLKDFRCGSGHDLDQDLQQDVTLQRLEALSAPEMLTRIEALLRAACAGTSAAWPLTAFLKVLQTLILIRRHTESGAYLEALRLADAEYYGASDAVLLACAKLDAANSWQYVSRLRDREAAAALVFACVQHYDYEDARDALLLCKSVPAFATFSSNRMRQLRVCHEISQLRGLWGDDSGAQDWRHWDAALLREQTGGMRVMRTLLEYKQFDLAKDVELCYFPNQPAVSVDIDSDALLHRVEHMDSGGRSALRAHVDGLSDPIATVKTVLQLTRNFEGRVVLYEYLCERYPDDPLYRSSLQGAQALCALPDEELEVVRGPRRLSFSSDSVPMAPRHSLRLALAHLEAHPKALVETLLMNERVSELSRALQHVPTLRDDAMLRSYARRALIVRHVTASASSLSSSALSALKPRSSDSLFAKSALNWVLTGGEADEATRSQHRFASVPSINLATALLDLGRCRRSAARTCLDVCHELSAHLSSTAVTQHLLIVNLIKQLLFYAKLQFTRQLSEPPVVAEAVAAPSEWIVNDGGGGDGGVAVCQTFLSHVDLLHDLYVLAFALRLFFRVVAMYVRVCLVFAHCERAFRYVEDCGVVCTFEDLAQPSRARIVRDRLIELDRINLAHAVATQCRVGFACFGGCAWALGSDGDGRQVESEPVWLAWGLCLLRSGDYEAAKEKVSSMRKTQFREIRFFLNGKFASLRPFLFIVWQEFFFLI